MSTVRWDSAIGGGTAVGGDTAQSDSVGATPGVRTSDVGDSERTQVLRPLPPYPQRPEEVRDLFQRCEAAPTGHITGHITEPGDRSASPWPDEAFQAPAARSRSPQITGITVLAVVVLGLVAATVAYLLIPGPGRSDDDQITVFQPTTALRDVPPPHGPPVNTADALITPEGTDRGSRSFEGLLELASAAQLPESILNALHANEMSDAVLKATTLAAGGKEVKIGMYAFTLPDAQKAIAVAQDIVAAEVRSDGGIKITNAQALRGVTVMRSVPGSVEPVYRAVYVLYNRVIFFEVLGKNRDDADAVLNTFTSLVDKQVITHAPPTIRGN
ncbi:MAG: hypothetical protein JO272_10060 [Pseudonocardiales bacterium]|nr:hypothetical protein [Pseudonocardiales bacterium]